MNNLEFYNAYIKNNSYLDYISFNDNYLYLQIDDEIIKKVDFNTQYDLDNLPDSAYKVNNPNIFLDILEINNKCKKILTDISNNYPKELNDNQKITRYYTNIRSILSKDICSAEDLKEIADFLKDYNSLVKYNGFLNADAKKIHQEMKNIVYWPLEIENQKETNYAQKIIREYIENVKKGYLEPYEMIDINNNGSATELGASRKLTNPNTPKIFEDDFNMDKAGFFSFFTLLYIAFNLLVALVILAIKK